VIVVRMSEPIIVRGYELYFVVLQFGKDVCYSLHIVRMPVMYARVSVNNDTWQPAMSVYHSRPDFFGHVRSVHS